MPDLTPKQLRFIDEYLVDFIGKQAAIRAGYSAKTAEVQASRLLRNAKVQAEVQRRAEKRRQKLEINSEKVLNEVAKLGFSNMMDFIKVDEAGNVDINLKDLTREQAAAISELNVESWKEGKGEAAKVVTRTKFKLAPKTPNLELLGKHLKLWTEVREHKFDLKSMTDAQLAELEHQLSEESAGGSAA